MSATLTSKGQITIPKEVREKLKLQTGDKLEFLIQEDGTARVIPVTSSIKELRGLIPKPKKAVSLEDMDKAVEKGALG
jgi:antitoxin PrlF